MNHSPMPVQLLSFFEALEEVADGKKVTKIEWKNPLIYIHLNSGFLMLHKEDGKDYRLTPSDGDILGKDWVVVHE